MVILGYFYREAREAASIDAAWRSATQALGATPSSNKSVGTAAIKPTTTDAKPATQPTPSLSRPAAPSSYFAALTQQATNLASSVRLTGFPDISFGPTSDGSLFEFSDHQRQAAKSILDEAAVSSNATDSSSAAGPASSMDPMGLQNAAASPAADLALSAKSSPEFLARGRSSSVWSSAASVSSVTQRGRNSARGNVVW